LNLKTLILIVFISIFGTSFSQNLNDSVSFELDTIRAIEAEFLDPIDTVVIADSLVNEVVESDTTVNENIFSNENVKMYFNVDSIAYRKSMIISNVLTVINQSSEDLKFYNELIYPSAWQSFSFADKVNYTLKASDTLKIPISLIPSKGLLGGTSVYITAILKDTSDENLGDLKFGIRTQKSINWTTDISPESRMYLRNGEKSKEITYTLTNTGTNKQDFFVNLKSFKNDIIVTDTIGNRTKTNNTFTLDRKTDTSIYMKLTALRIGERNFKQISTINYHPNSDLFKKNYTIFIESSEPKTSGGNLKKGEKIDLIQLPNVISVSDISNGTLPLTVDANLQNILDDNSFLNINLRGNKQLNRDANLIYFTQLNYNQVYWNTSIYRTLPWYIGYFDKTITAELGQVSGNVVGLSNFGKGAKGSYRYGANLEHQTQAYYVRNPTLFGPTGYQTYGVSHKYRINDKINVDGGIGRTDNPASNSTTNAANLNGRFRIDKKHFISVFLAGTNSDRIIQGSQFIRNGYQAGLNYSSNFLSRRLRVSAGGRYNDKNFSSGSFERINANHVSSFLINDDWTVSMNNFYNKTSNYNIVADTIVAMQELQNNSVIFTTNNSVGSFQPGLFYNYSNLNTGRIHSRGLSFRYSKVKFENNFLTSLSMRAGYNDAVDLPELRNYFIFEATTLLRYRVWTVTARYNYGANSPVLLNYLALTDRAPQTFRFSLQNQYQFKNPHFVLENSVAYTYNNLLSSHNLSLFPEFFYFSNSGWRLSLNANYGFNSNNYGSIYSALNQDPFLSESVETNTNYNVNFGVSVRKNFKLPIPFLKDNAVDVTFIAFYDVNGNGIKDGNEPNIPNVVINIDKRNEVLSDRNGEALAKNIPLGNHKIELISLDPIEGWFANLPDSCEFNVNGQYFLPYVRGIKVYGDVALDRQEIANVDKDKQFDLSRIRITATNGQVYHTLTDIDGKFEFYMPNGDYIITLDENVLGSKYTISKNNIPLKLEASQTNVYVSFYISEKKREVKIKNFGDDW
jgi:hypothetical protein